MDAIIPAAGLTGSKCLRVIASNIRLYINPLNELIGTHYIWWANSKSELHLVKIKQWREEKGLSQQQLADALNELAEKKGWTEPATSQAGVDRWEHGSIPRQENIRLVGELTGGKVGFGDFLGDDGPKKRKPRDRAVSIAASRKGAATKKRQRAALQ